MSITETEAHKKWCPMIAVLPPPEIGDKLCCIASRCMMWEWGETAHWEGDISGKTPEDSDGKLVRRGDCGLKRRTP